MFGLESSTYVQLELRVCPTCVEMQLNDNAESHLHKAVKPRSGIIEDPDIQSSLSKNPQCVLTKILHHL